MQIIRERTARTSSEQSLAMEFFEAEVNNSFAFQGRATTTVIAFAVMVNASQHMPMSSIATKRKYHYMNAAFLILEQLLRNFSAFGWSFCGFRNARRKALALLEDAT